MEPLTISNYPLNENENEIALLNPDGNVIFNQIFVEEAKPNNSPDDMLKYFISIQKRKTAIMRAIQSKIEQLSMPQDEEPVIISYGGFREILSSGKHFEKNFTVLDYKFLIPDDVFFNFSFKFHSCAMQKWFFRWLADDGRNFYIPNGGIEKETGKGTIWLPKTIDEDLKKGIETVRKIENFFDYCTVKPTEKSAVGYAQALRACYLCKERHAYDDDGDFFDVHRYPLDFQQY